MIRIFILCAFVLVFTLLIFALCRAYSLRHAIPRQRVIVTMYFCDFDSFEPALCRIVRLYDHFDVTLRVIDMISTDESERWLRKLSQKTDTEFDIIRR